MAHRCVAPPSRTADVQLNRNVTTCSPVGRCLKVVNLRENKITLDFHRLYFIRITGLVNRNHSGQCRSAVVTSYSAVKSYKRHSHPSPVADELAAEIAAFGQAAIIQSHLHSVPLIHCPQLSNVIPIQSTAFYRWYSTAYPALRRAPFATFLAIFIDLHCAFMYNISTPGVPKLRDCIGPYGVQ
jgi:hypothetical protein